MKGKKPPGFAARLLRHLFSAVVYGLIGLVAGGLIVTILQARSRPDLSPWHLADLDEEFTAEKSGRIHGLDGYLKLEDRLFSQLEKTVVAKTAAADKRRLNRYAAGSWSDPGRFAVNWNRTFELPIESPVAGFLLLHGLTDSPYSFRAIAGSLHACGAWVVGLRIPGHGTAPAGLARVDRRDFTAAVRMAARHLSEKIGKDRPLYIAGYSNGAALALGYTLAVLEGEPLPAPAGLLLISPAVAVTPAAALARVNLWLSKIPGLEKLAWLSIEPEYDPFKYNSFPVNAGDQIYRLTRDIAARLDRLDKGGGITGFPPVLAFQSVVDATIPADALVNRLLRRLSPNDHALVLFDVNRESETAAFLSEDPRPWIDGLLSQSLPFDLTVITNRSPDTRQVHALRKKSGRGTPFQEPLALSWPDGVYSLSHVAPPFSPEDPLYGNGKEGGGRAFTLGGLELRGERNLLQVGIGDLMRLRYNPFYAVLEKRITDRYFPRAVSVAPDQGGN